ncbi:hypothetical protein TNCV_3854601 [Trichonephila clavipes]|nr:hypothetical protein TNCV_3854601 [Trichonephila clavipes]
MNSAFTAWGYSKQPSSRKSSREAGGRGCEKGFSAMGPQVEFDQTLVLLRCKLGSRRYVLEQTAGFPGGVYTVCKILFYQDESPSC